MNGGTGSATAIARSATNTSGIWRISIPIVAAWRAEKEAIARELPRLRTYQGKLGSSAQLLADALEDDVAAR